jgi:hypothetical protein
MLVDVTSCQQEQARCVIDTITTTPSMRNKAAKRAYAPSGQSASPGPALAEHQQELAVRSLSKGWPYGEGKSARGRRCGWDHFVRLTRNGLLVHHHRAGVETRAVRNPVHAAALIPASGHAIQVAPAVAVS